jgi:hypothetical protein
LSFISINYIYFPPLYTSRRRVLGFDLASIPPKSPRDCSKERGAGRDDKNQTVCIIEGQGLLQHTQKADWLGGHLMESQLMVSPSITRKPQIVSRVNKKIKSDRYIDCETKVWGFLVLSLILFLFSK